MFVFVVYCVGSGLCDELITCSEESYLVCVCVCVGRIVCDTETSTMCVLQRLIAGAIEWPLNCDDIHVQKAVIPRCSTNRFTRFLIT
jgi:hypothetical protein